jgi:hypothetical protein
MGAIKIKFGYPLTEEGDAELSRLAIECDCSIETALRKSFERLANYLIQTQETEEGFFDLFFSAAVDEGDVVCPAIDHGVYISNGYKLPMFIFSDDCLKPRMRNEKWHHSLSDPDINAFGERFQIEFDYEYVCFERS